MPSGKRHMYEGTESGGKRARGPREKEKEISEIEERLENLILRVGEKSSSSLESNLEGLCGVLEADLSTYKSKILKILGLCVTSMPEKLTIYTTLVGLLNAKNYNFGGEFVDLLLNKLRDALMECDFDNALHIIVFISDLVNSHVVSAHSCLNFLDRLSEVVQEEDSPQARADWYAYAVLHTLPWVGRELWDKRQADLDGMLDKIEGYLGRREKIHGTILRVWTSGKPHPQEEYLDSLWAQVSKMRMDGWQEKQIFRHYVAFHAVLSESLQHTLPNFIPPAHHPDHLYPLPRVIFRMFDYTDCPEDGPILPGAHSIERFLVEQDLNWLIKQYHTERKDCAAALLQYSKHSQVPLNYMILEVVFGQLFQLPKPPHVELFYGVLLIELCKLQPNSMPQVLAQAAELLYLRIETMQVACIDRFVDWFAYHLSNFQFRWSWEDWTDALELDALSAKQMFIREVLHKCVRFSFHQRVLEIVPSSFSSFIPPKPEPTFKYSQDGAQNLPGTSIAHQLAQAVRSRASAEDLLKLLKDCPNPSGEEMEIVESGGAGGFNPLAVDVFTLTLLHLGGKSFSHSFAALAKYHSVMKGLTENNEAAQLCVLQAVFELWHKHPQMIYVLVDKMLKMQIVECATVVQWVFSEDLKDVFLRMWVWETLQSALVKLSRHVQRLRLDLDRTREKLATDGATELYEQDGEKRTEAASELRENIAELEEKLEGAENVQKNLLLTVYQKFTILLTEHLLACEAEGKDFDTLWYRWVIGRFRQMFLAQHVETAKHVETLESSLFTSDIDPHILEVFHQFCALRK